MLSNRRPNGSYRCCHRMLALTTACFATAASAQITLDGTLGPTGTLTGPDYDISADLGRQVGGNLFHSFGAFNVDTGESATFSGPGSVGNVIGRVTGGQVSRIDGLLRNTIPDADLYLLNPAGVMFGPNARLNVGGSFYASTADGLRLEDGGHVDAREPGNSVLTSAPPAAFGFLDDAPASLSTQGSLLVVPPGETLGIVAGDVRLNETFVGSVSGRVVIAGVTGQGEVVHVPGAPALTARPGQVTVSSSVISTDGVGDGAIFIRAGRFVADNSVVQARTLGAGTGGTLDIAAEQVQITNGTALDTSTFASGQGGEIRIRAAEELVLAGVDIEGAPSGIFSRAESAGDAGRVSLEAVRLIMTDGAMINTQSLATGRAGDIDLRITGLVDLSGQSPAVIGSFISATTRSAGDAGTITLKAGELHLADGGQISASTLGTGQAGALDIDVTGSAVVSGESGIGFPFGISAILAQSTSTGEAAGDAGRITLSAGALNLEDGAALSADSFGPGRGGDVDLHVGTLTLSGENSVGLGSSIAASPRSQATRDAAASSGILRIEAQRITLADGGQIGTSTFGSVPGGDIEIDVAQELVISGQDSGGFFSGIFAETLGAGPGGSIALQARRIRLADGGQISLGSIGAGNAGNLSLDVEERLRMENGFILTSTLTADGGNVDMSSSGFMFLTDSQITTSVGAGEGDGGNISLTPEVLVLDNSRISANAFGGDGGNIRIAVTQLIADPTSTIDASSELGIDGRVTIEAPDSDISGILAVLPSAFSDPAAVLPTPCAERLGTNVTRLVVRRYDVLPDSPYALRVHLPADGAWEPLLGAPDNPPAWLAEGYPAIFEECLEPERRQ